MNRFITCAAAGGALLILAGAATTALAADRDFCRDYARAAVRQVRGADSHMRCIRHIDQDSGRWSDDFRHHFDWCLGVSRDQADAERDARRATLDRCARR